MAIGENRNATILEFEVRDIAIGHEVGTGRSKPEQAAGLSRIVRPENLVPSNKSGQTNAINFRNIRCRGFDSCRGKPMNRER